MAESLRHRGLDVTLVEMARQLLPTLDPEMSSLLAAELRQAGIAVELGAAVTGFAPAAGGGVRAAAKDGRSWTADLVALCVGVKPNSDLARAAGLEMGAKGHILTNAHMRTSDPDIYAVGDVVAVREKSKKQLRITEAMKLAAAEAIFSVVSDELSVDKIVPSPLDPRVEPAVAAAVAAAGAAAGAGAAISS